MKRHILECWVSKDEDGTFDCWTAKPSADKDEGFGIYTGDYCSTWVYEMLEELKIFDSISPMECRRVMVSISGLTTQEVYEAKQG